MNSIQNDKNGVILRWLKKDSSGVALLLALGMMGLLFVVAVGFVSTSQVDYQIATVNCSKSQAENLAISSVNIAVGLLKTLYADTSVAGDTSTPFRELNIGPLSTSDSVINLDSRRVIFSVGDVLTDSDYLYRFATNFTTGGNSFSFIDWPNNQFFSTEGSGATGSPSSRFIEQVTPSWIYVHDTTNTTDSLIVGRYAFMIIDETGKLNPYDLSISSDTTVRYGANNGEWWSRFTSAATNASKAYDAVASDTDFVGQRELAMNVWKSEHSRKINHIAYLDLGPDTTTMECYNYNGTRRHRFNLARTDWNSSSMSADKLVCAPQAYSETDSPSDGDGIPWLNEWSSSNAGTYPNSNARAKQIAANIIDYCDIDCTPTIDPLTVIYTSEGVDSYYPSTAPKYVGLEKNVPKINEVALDFSCDVAHTSGGDPLVHNYDYTLKIKPPGIELWYWNYMQINDDADSIPVHVTPYIRVKMDITTLSDSPDFSITETITRIVPIADSLLPADISDKGAIVGVEPVGTDIDLWHHEFTNVPAPLNDLKLKIDITSLEAYSFFYNGSTVTSQLMDYCVLPTCSKEIADGSSILVDYEAYDPRQNINSGDWATQNTHSINSTNITIATGAEGDNDGLPGNTFSGCSSRFIRNKPMKSLWELGAIHRGAKWETLNLKTYTSSTPGTYAQGDAGILNQVKLNAYSSNPKININSKRCEIWQAMLKNLPTTISTTDNYANCAGYDGNSDQSAKVDSILADNGGWNNRGQLANVTVLSTDASMTKDLEKEAIIGKTANLFWVDQTKELRTRRYSVIAIAQSIKDLPLNATIKLDLDNDGTIGSVKESTSNKTYGFYADYDCNGIIEDSNITESIVSRRGRYDLYVDKITGTAKIYAEIEGDSTATNFKITNMCFLGSSSTTDYSAP